MLFIWLAIALIVLLIAVYNAHLRLDITYKKLNNNDIFIVQLSTFYGIIRYRIEMPLIDFINKMNSYRIKLKFRTKKEKEIKPKTISDIFEMLDNFINTYKLYEKSTSYLIKKIYIKNLLIKIEYGFNDAYLAVICYGLLYILIINILFYLQSCISLHVKNIMIKPDFYEEVLNLEFNCIIGIKIGYIISALKMFLKTSRGSEINGTAYRRSYENNYGKNQGND